MRMMTAQSMMIAVSAEFKYPWNIVAGSCVIGRKLSVIFRNPALSVVTETNASGTSVTQAYLCFPEFMIAVVATHSATLASN